MIERRFHDLGRVVDEVHTLFDDWAQEAPCDDAPCDDAPCDDAPCDDAPCEAADEFGLFVMKLAVHEWIANLVQHADFRGVTPEIRLFIETEEQALRCAIEDNSAGFDFHAHLGRQHAAVHGPEPSERGRGLLMLIACTEDLAYETAETGCQRIAFRIRVPVEPESLATLFPPTDHL